MDEINNTRSTTHELIVKVWRAKKINQVCGCEVVTPFTLDQLDDEWLDVFEELHGYETHERSIASAEAQSNAEFERVLASKRASNGYRSYLN